MPTFTTRFYTIYYCGWWCRGSTHLQMWWQGWTAHKTSWESWPAYGVSTYMDGELTKVEEVVISSSCMWNIGIHFQNPGNTEMYIISVVRLRIRPDITTPAWIDWCILNENSHFTTIVLVHLWSTIPIWHAPAHQRTHALIAVLDHRDPFQPFHNGAFGYHYIYLYKLSVNITWFSLQHSTLSAITNATDYWPLARKYSIWNAAVAALQFWAANLKAHVLSSTIEQVYNALVYTTSMHLLCQQSDEVLFGHFVNTLNAAFESKLALEDEGYESGSENFNIPTPLRHTSRIHHVSSDDNTSFDPTTPCSAGTS